MDRRRRELLRGGIAAVAGIAGCQSLGSSGDRSDGTGAGRTETPTPAPPAGGAAEGTPIETDLRVAWTEGPDMPQERTQTTAVGLDGELYVIGGIVGDEADRHTAVYSPDDEAWRTVAPPPEPVNHTSAVALDGRIHVLGGYSGSFLGSPPLSAHWIYEPEEDRWTDAPSLPTPRGALVSEVVDGRIYAIGGAADDGTTRTAEAYEPGDESWVSVARMPTAREHLAAGAVDGSVYVAGGRKGLSPMVDATERYDPGAEAWTGRTAMPTARAGIAGDVLAGRLFVFGGEEVGTTVFGEVEAYHPPSDSWTAVTPLPTPRWGLGVASIGDRIYTVGGGAVPSAEYTATLEVLSIDRSTA